ncbi:hypothetical protein D7V94_13840 [Parablautia intestinalis]|uniref:DNA-binding protein n=1 Tax=Parablautia intestinalis TaxID=2320100 RepID=A0A3A9AGZ2_9FIRM|nr:hypothetical protein D7V94_13840 [Parablautia intestinalis]
MRKTTESQLELKHRMLISTADLQELLSCGRSTTVKIGTEAGAKVQIGKRVLWNREKIQKYLNERS